MNAPGEPEPRPSHLPETEFEDEPPGNYLAELSPGIWSLVWASVNLGLILAVALLWFSGGLGRDAPGRAPAAVVWSLLPASAGIVLAVFLWLALAARAGEFDRRGRIGVGLALLTLVAWCVLRYGFRVHFVG